MWRSSRACTSTSAGSSPSLRGSSSSSSRSQGRKFPQVLFWLVVLSYDPPRALGPFVTIYSLLPFTAVHKAAPYRRDFYERLAQDASTEKLDKDLAGRTRCHCSSNYRVR